MNLLFVNSGCALYKIFAHYLADDNIFLSTDIVSMILDIVEDNAIDVIILDHRIKNATARSLIRRLRQKAKVIMVTSNKILKLNPGYSLVVEKPQPKEFVAIVRSFEEIIA